MKSSKEDKKKQRTETENKQDGQLKPNHTDNCIKRKHSS